MCVCVCVCGEDGTMCVYALKRAPVYVLASWRGVGGVSVSLLINLKRGVFKYNWGGGGVVGKRFLGG